MPDEVIFLQEYFVYCKKKWRSADERAPLFGRVDGFQIDPNKTAAHGLRSANCGRFGFSCTGRRGRFGRRHGIFYMGAGFFC